MNTGNTMTKAIDALDDARERRLAASSVGRLVPIWANDFYFTHELDHGGDLDEYDNRPAHFMCLARDNRLVDDSPSPEELLAEAEEAREHDWDTYDGRVLGELDHPPQYYAQAA